MTIPTSVIGTEFPPLTVAVERGQLASFARATGQSDARYSDVEAARSAGHHDLPVPPTFLFGLNFAAPDPFAWIEKLGVDLRHVLHGEQRFTYRSVAHAGEVLVLRARIADTYSKNDGALDFIVRRTDVERQDGSPVAELEEVVVIRNAEVGS
jgi:hypothetical protein